MERYSRRRFVRLGASGLVVTLAGCGESEDDGQEEGGEGGEGDQQEGGESGEGGEGGEGGQEESGEGGDD